MKETNSPENLGRRVHLVDALRGFALMGIFLLHHVEHFNLFGRPIDPIGPFSLETDRAVFRTLYMLFAGKCYAIFALMFGFSFWVQMERQIEKGNPFMLRFAWRMLVLVGFGQFHAFFYSGDIVMVYAVLSMVLLVTWRLPDWFVLLLAALFLIQPFYMTRFIYFLTHPEQTQITRHGNLWGELGQLYNNGNLGEVLIANVTKGQKANLTWAWDHGRYFQTPGLFLLGMLAAKKRIFTEDNWRFWTVILFVSFVIWLPLHFARQNFQMWVTGGHFRYMLRLILDSYRNLSHMLVWLSLISLLWRFQVIRMVFSPLIALGRMSLTNYISIGIIGAFLYHSYGLHLHRYCGATISLFIGLVSLTCHCVFSMVWLKYQRYGPLEYIWHKLTWIRFSRK
ncbi:MAG: DUF418 domain-containing protein [Opitutales bacterium]|nr:DUF418 domain-containing protein [Opitutales bacterium]